MPRRGERGRVAKLPGGGKASEQVPEQKRTPSQSGNRGIERGETRKKTLWR